MMEPIATWPTITCGSRGGYLGPGLDESDVNDGKASEIFMGGTNFVRTVRADRL